MTLRAVCPALLLVLTPLAVLVPCGLPVLAAGPTHPSINTGGYDYDPQVLLNDLKKADWLATHHDWVIGLQTQGVPTGTDPHTGLPRVQKLPEVLFDRMKAANPEVRFFQYLPAFTLNWQQGYIDAWMRAKGRPVEDAWCHYRCDVQLKTRATQCVDAVTGQPCTPTTPPASKVAAQVFRKVRGYGGTAAECAAMSAETLNTAAWLVDDETGAGTYVMASTSGGVREGSIGPGTGSEPSRSRMRSTWLGGAHPAACPRSDDFVEAYAALATEMIRVARPAATKWADGLLLDTFEGIADSTWRVQLNWVSEYRAAGGTTHEAARRIAVDDLAALQDAVETALRGASGAPVRVLANAGDVDYVFRASPAGYADLYHERFGRPDDYDEVSVEFLLTTALSSTARIPRLRQLFDQMNAGTREPVATFVNSQSNFTEGTWPAYEDPYPGSCSRQTSAGAIPWRYSHFVLATHYLVRHDNGVFSYHKGSAANYGTYGSGYAASHWDPALRANLGLPAYGTPLCDGLTVAHDYWGRAIGGSTRFYVCRQGKDETLLARNFSRGFVLAKFPAVSGICRHGAERRTVLLPRPLRQVQADGSLGPVVTSVTLGWTEGAIFVNP